MDISDPMNDNTMTAKEEFGHGEIEGWMVNTILTHWEPADIPTCPSRQPMADEEYPQLSWELL